MSQHYIKKVVAYIIRKHSAIPELLIFSQPGHTEAGWQVPAGTVENNEKIEEALLREIREESNLEEFSSIDYLGNQKFFHPHRKEWHDRYYFWLKYDGAGPQRFEHRVTGSGEEEGVLFSLAWTPLSRLPKLAGEQDYFLSELIYIVNN